MTAREVRERASKGDGEGGEGEASKGDGEGGEGEG